MAIWDGTMAVAVSKADLGTRAYGLVGGVERRVLWETGKMCSGLEAVGGGVGVVDWYTI